MKVALSIAGSDSSGGAGIQADIKTMQALGVFATTAITAVTAQNTLGVRSIQNIDPAIVADQIDAVFEDLRPVAIKIGMLASAELIETIADRLQFHQAERIILDPVMVATSGARLLPTSAIQALKNSLFPLAELITPNLPEAEALLDRSIETQQEMEEAAQQLHQQYGCSVLIKGGHQVNVAQDVCAFGNTVRWFHGTPVNVRTTHGTGCTLSSAIASYRAQDFDLTASIDRAKKYLEGALRAGLHLGAGSMPLNHGYLHLQ